MAEKEGSKAAGFKMCPDMPFVTQDLTNPDNYIVDVQAANEYLNITTDTSYQRRMDGELKETML